MKRKVFVLCFIIMCMLTFLSLNTFANSDITTDSSEVSIIEYFDIYSDKGNQTDITRGEAAKIFSKFFGESYKGAECSFPDVDKSNPYYEEISIVVAAKVMNGDSDGNFYPGNKISVLDFIVSAVRLANFTDYAEALGGYPNGYFEIANKYDLIPSGSKWTDALTPKVAMRILERVAEMPYCQISGVKMYDEEAIYSYYADGDQTVFEQYFSLEKKEAVVAAINNVSINGYEAPGEGVVILVDGTAESYKTTFVGNDAHLGFTVEYFLDNESGEVVFLRPRNNKAEVYYFDYFNMESISPDRTKISYYKEEKNKVQEIRIAYDATFIYNGKNYSDILPEEMLRNNVEIKAYDVNDDRVLDVVWVYEYEYIVVEAYDAVGKNIIDGLNGGIYCFSTDSFKDGVKLYKDGKISSFSVINEGDLICVLTDKNNTTRTGYISKDVISGAVSSINLSDNEITIGDKEYKLQFELESSGISLRDEINLYFDVSGKAVTFDFTMTNNGEYAYLLNVAEDDRGLSKKVSAKVVKNNGEIVVLDFEKKFKINGVRSTYLELEEALMRNDTLHQLVFIKYRNDNIYDIGISNQAEGFPYYDTEFKGFTLNYESKIGESVIYSSNIGKKFYTESLTKTFYISVDDFGNVNEDEIFVDSYSSLGIKQDIKPKLKAYDMNIYRVPKALVIYGTSGKFTDYISNGGIKTGNIMIVDEIRNVLVDDEYKLCIRGLFLGIEREFYAGFNTNLDSIRCGDAIYINNYRGKELYKYTLVFRKESVKYDDDSILALDKQYTQENPAVNAPAASRYSMSRIYGEVKEVGTIYGNTSVSYQNDRAPTYALVIQPEGETDPDGCYVIRNRANSNSDNTSTHVYVYDTDSDVAYCVNIHDIELTGKKVFCYFAEGVARAIVVYE